MARYFFGTREAGNIQEASFEQIIQVVKGSSIVSLADWGPDRLELGLSGSAMLRITFTGNTVVVNVFSTANPGDPTAVPLPLGEMPQRVEARVIERKVRGLRTAYAIFYLLETGRAAALQAYLLRHPDGDIERALLENDERLYIESVSYGSWILTAWLKTKHGLRAVGDALATVYARGREAWLQTLEHKARMTGAEADRKEIDVARAKFELARDRFDYILSLTNRLEDPAAREEGQRRLRTAFRQIMSGDEEEADARDRIRLLPGGTKGEDDDVER